MAKRSYSKNQPGGYCGLDETGKISVDCIPDGMGEGGSSGNIDGGAPDSVYGGAVAIDAGGP